MTMFERAAGRLFLPACFGLAAAALVLSSLPAASEIYQWTDDQGTVHFTDEPSAIPPAARGKERLLLREPPISIQSPPAAYAPPSPPAAEAGSGEAGETPDAGEPTIQAEQLRAKITAKEDLIRAVDAKRSLATNPLRNRFVSPSDLELYRKYQAELPGDRERLRELESRIDSLNR